MSSIAEYGLIMVEEDEATGDVAEIYDEYKRDMQAPSVPNWVKTLAISPEALKIYMSFYRTLNEQVSLPMSLISVIGFAIAEQNNCTYCTALNELSCRTLGVDDDTLAAIVKNIDTLNPVRIRVIIEFVLKAAKNPKALSPADYDAVRAQGISDGEIVQLILVTSMFVMNDTLADALKIHVDDQVASALNK